MICSMFAPTCDTIKGQLAELGHFAQYGRYYVFDKE